MVLMVDARTLGSQPSGIGISTYNFLIEIQKEKSIRLILVSDVATSNEMQEFEKLGVEIITYGEKVFRSFGVFAYFNFVRKQAVKYQPDLFWEPNNLIPLPMVGYKGKIVLTIHDIFPITAPDNYGLVYQLYFRFLLHRSLHMADLILYVSEFSKKQTETYSKQANKKQSLVIYNIIHKSNFDGVEEKTEKDYFLYLGAMCKRKGTDTLIKAYEKYAETGGKRKLYMAGGMSEQIMATLVEEINQNIQNTQCKIEYLGYVTKDEKQNLLANCACFIFPSRAEGFGMPLVEAMHYYRPVIASDLEIFHELIDDEIIFYKSESDVEKESSILAKTMLQFDEDCKNGAYINKQSYDAVMGRFLPEVLGDFVVKQLLEFGK